MEYILERLDQLHAQRESILDAAMQSARASDLNPQELEIFDLELSQALDDAFFDHTNPLIEELDQRGWAEADRSALADAVDFQARVR